MAPSRPRLSGVSIAALAVVAFAGLIGLATAPRTAIRPTIRPNGPGGGRGHTSGSGSPWWGVSSGGGWGSYEPASSDVCGADQGGSDCGGGGGGGD